MPTAGGWSVHILDEFLVWLQRRLSRLGIVGLIRGVLGVLGFGALLSSLLGEVAIKSGFIVAAILSVLGVLAILLVDRSGAIRKIDLNHRLLTRYCGFLKHHVDQRWRITRWEESAVLKSNGDADERITVTAVVETEFLYFFAVRTGAGWDQSRRVRRRVRIGVASFEGEGLGSSEWDVTSEWLLDGRIEVAVHFSRPMRQGMIMKLTLDKYWPGKWAPLMKEGYPDACALKFSCPIEYVEYSVLLPVGCRVHCDPVGLREGVDDYVLDMKALGTEQVEARLVAREIAERQRVGMLLRLKSDLGHLMRVN